MTRICRFFLRGRIALLERDIKHLRVDQDAAALRFQRWRFEGDYYRWEVIGWEIEKQTQELDKLKLKAGMA